MQKVIELNCEETKAVVGGVLAVAAPATRAVLRKESPLAEIFGIIIRDIENCSAADRWRNARNFMTAAGYLASKRLANLRAATRMMIEIGRRSG